MHQATVRIRRPTRADLDALALLFDLYRQFYQQPADLARARNYLEARMARQESIILLACSASDSAVGFCQMYPSFCSVASAPIVTLYDLFVRPDARRSGAGKQLLLAAAAVARERGVVRMDLSTAHGNRAAQALYESLGWQRDTEFASYSLSL